MPFFLIVIITASMLVAPVVGVVASAAAPAHRTAEAPHG